MSLLIRNNEAASRVSDAGRPPCAEGGLRKTGGNALMGIIIWLVVGGVVGWLASLIMRTDAQQGIILNIVVGIVGAVIAGLVLGKGNINGGLTIETFLWSLLGAVILLAIVNLIRRVSVR
jgi:uncharacterized membrane protein YeaQ/YmgE (transglycosylase-associated protein family)